MKERSPWKCKEHLPARHSQLPFRSILHGEAPECCADEVLTQVIQEFSTSLTTIAGFAEILLGENHYGKIGPKQQREFLSFVHDKSKALNRVVGALSDVSLIQSGKKILLDYSKNSVEGLFHEALKSFQQGHGTSRFEVILGQGTTEVWGDRKRLLNVLENLIDNAVKFSPDEGSIRLVWTTSGGWGIISVEDEGIGISMEQIEKIFAPFYRIDRSNNAPSGLGLGLPIAKAIVEGHGGQLSVESELGRGTKVLIVIPLQQSSRSGHWPSPDNVLT